MTARSSYVPSSRSQYPRVKRWTYRVELLANSDWLDYVPSHARLSSERFVTEGYDCLVVKHPQDSGRCFAATAVHRDAHFLSLPEEQVQQRHLAAGE